MYEKRFGFSSTGGISWAVLEDLSFCAKVIGDHASLRSDEGVKPIIDILMDVVYNCSRSKCVHEFQDDPYYSFAKSALIKTNSGYAAGRLLAYSSFLGHIPVSEYSSPGKKENLERQASIALEILVKGGAKIDESALIESVGSRKDINSGDIGLLLEYGGVKSFRYVMEMLAVNDLPDHDSCKDGRFFNLLLHGIKKYKFEPKMIGHFNDMVSKIASDDDAINNYYKSLSFFAKFFKPLFGEDLYDYLETKGIQFFNSWVYKPK